MEDFLDGNTDDFQKTVTNLKETAKSTNYSDVEKTLEEVHQVIDLAERYKIDNGLK